MRSSHSGCLRRGFGLAVALLGASAGVVGIALWTMRSGAVLDDFEGRVRAAEWAFEAGLPGQGARGAFERSGRGARFGAKGGELRFDFTRGGTYVQATLPLRLRGSMGGVSLWIKASSGNLIALRVRDSEDQVFQREMGLAPRDWTQFTVPFSDWNDSYGGRGDGIMRGEPKAIAVVVANTSTRPAGAVWFDDVRRLPLRPAQARWSAKLPPHPRLLISARELGERRRVVNGTPWLRALLDRHVREARAAQLAGIRVPSEGGQCEHWYACPTHGATLRMEGPRRHVCPVDGKVYTGKPYDQVWVTKQHKRLSRLARQAAIVYALSGDRTCLDVARTIVAEYARRYRGYPLHDIHGRPGKGGKVLSQSLDDADWLVPLLQAADLIYADLTEADRRRIVEDVIRPAVNEVIRPGRLRFHNIQCRHNAAIGLGGFFAGDDDLIAEAMDGARGFEAQVRHMVNQDGQWAEGSWGYHFYALDALITLAEAARICGRDLFMSRLRPMFAAPIQAAMPNGDLPKFNDDSGVRLADRSEYEMAPSRFGDPAFAGPVRQSQRDTWRTLLYGAPYPSEGPPSARGLRLMPDSGYAILAPERGSTAWACLKYGPHGGDHGHPDKNGLVVFGGGVPIMEDPGVGAYLTGLADGWFKTTPAHNTVAADRRDQRPASGGLIAFEQFGDGSGALTDAGWAMAGVRHRRAAFMIGSETLVALDMLASLDGRAHDLDLFWHPSGRWASSPVGTPTRTEARPGYRYFAGLRSTPVRTPSPYPARAMGVWGRSVGFVTGSRTRQLTVVATAPRWELMLGTGPGAHTGERRPAAIVRQRAVSGAFATAISLEPTRIGSRVRIVAPTMSQGDRMAPGDAVGAEVVTASGRWLLVANPDRASIRCGAWSGTDALALQRLGRAQDTQRP